MSAQTGDVPDFLSITEFKLTRHSEQPVAIWGNAGAHPVVLRYDPNLSLAMLHALLVGCINPLGRGTGYLRDYLTGAREFDQSKAQKVRVFSSHTILDYWAPHFTLLNPYSGPNASGLATVLERLARDIKNRSSSIQSVSWFKNKMGRTGSSIGNSLDKEIAPIEANDPSLPNCFLESITGKPFSLFPR